MKAVSALMRPIDGSGGKISPLATAGQRDGWLFAAASRPVLVVEQCTGRIVEANPAAFKLLDSDRNDLIGTPLTEAFADSSSDALRQSIAAAQASGHATQIGVRTRRGGSEVGVTLSTVRANSDSYLLVRLAKLPMAAEQMASEEVSSIVLDVIQDSHEGFVLTDLGLRVIYGNAAFAALAGVESVHELLGKSLAMWLELTQFDLSRMRDQMTQREAAEVWMTLLRQASGTLRPVEITAVAVPDGEDACWGFRVVIPPPTR
jgi:PAS domain S-box-containing protein